VASDSALFSPVGRSPLSLLVARQLREAILSGRLTVGTEVPTEKELTEQFAVSRSTVREALRILQAQGLLSGGDSVSTARPRVSAEGISTCASEALENAIRLQSIPLADLMELRLLLEGAALTAGVCDPASLEDARAALEVLRTPDIDITEFYEADVRFHICLAGTGGNAVFRLVMTAVRDAMGDYLLKALAALDDPAPVLAKLVDEHTSILAAIEAGRHPEAAKLVRAHIWDFYAGEMASNA
jgi:GntR family transcriptional repressor for pyruvate dehydrogenase complex